MGEPARRLGPVETLRTLVALTRADRVEHLTRLAARRPRGSVLVMPTGTVLVGCHPEVVKHVLVDHPERYAKGMGQRHAREILGDGLLTAEGAAWERQRTAARPYLRARAVQERLGLVVEAAQASARHLRESDGRTVDLTVPLAAYTLTCLARTFGFEPPDARRVHDAFEVVQDEAIFRAVTQGAVPSWARPRATAAVAGARAALAAEARAALRGSSRTDAWTSEEGMASLFLAGYETTASTLAWAVTFVAHDHALQDELAAEGERLEAAGAAGVAELASLTRAHAVFQETLRLRPPVWLVSRRVVEPDVVSGVRLRRGDEVLLLPGATSPDRSFEPYAPGAHAAGLAFGAGPRSCPGVSLAAMEAVVWLAVVARAVRWRPVVGAAPAPRARMSQTPAGGAVVEVRARPAVPQVTGSTRSRT